MHSDYWKYDEDKEEYIVRDVDDSHCTNYTNDDDCYECSYRNGCPYYKSLH